MTERPLEDIQAAASRAWSLALDIPTVDLDSDFLSLGGDSFAAVVLVETLAEELALPPDVGETLIVELFENPTPRQLAAWLHAAT